MAIDRLYNATLKLKEWDYDQMKIHIILHNTDKCYTIWQTAIYIR